MNKPLDLNDRTLNSRLKRMYARARLSILRERLAAALWRLLSWVFLFCGLWMLRIPQGAGQVVGIGVFIIFLLGLCYFFHRDLRLFRFPSREDVSKRLERDNNLEHRPLTGATDSLANPQKEESKALWLAGLRRAQSHLQKIKPAKPRHLISGKDPYALRLAAVLFFGLGLLLAGPDWKARVWEGLAPFTFAHSGKGALDNIRIVITPPAYTGLSQIIATSRKKKELMVPAGSMIKATVHGGFGRPHMMTGDHDLEFIRAGANDYVLDIAALPGTMMKVSQMFFTRAWWPYTYIPDTPPQISLKDKPQLSPDATLHFPLTLTDDYGVKTLGIHMELANPDDAPPIGKPYTERRAMQTPRGTAVDINPLYDLSSHPWAGQAVKIVFTAEDDLHQENLAGPITLILPERTFTHPVANELIVLRKKLIAHPLEGYNEIRQELESIIAQPNLYQRDSLVLLALRSAASRLFWSGVSVETAESMIPLLWDTALRLEDGNLSLVARDLRKAQNELANALQDPNATPQEISRLMQNLREALGQYFTEMQRDLQKRIAQGESIPIMPSDMMSKIISPDGLAAMLDQMEAQMMSGDRKAAEKLLSQLQNMMESFNPSGQQKLPPDMQAMMESAKALDELIKEQQALLDKTKTGMEHDKNTIVHNFGEPLPGNTKLLKQWGLDDMPPVPKAAPEKPSTFGTKDEQAEQEIIRGKLDDIMQKTGEALREIPKNMGDAEQEMRGSSGALGENHPPESIPHQQKAIDDMKEGQQQLSKEFMAKLAQMTGFSLGGMKFDPLGRPYGDNGNGELFPGSKIKIPDEAQRKQAQEIMRLLQGRAGELGRPDEELEYYRRLLRQF